jgi:hypothetical protein
LAWLGSWVRPRPASSRRGHEHPRGKKSDLQSGPELGETELVRVQLLPASAGCSEPAPVAGFGMLGVLGSVGSYLLPDNQGAARGGRRERVAMSHMWLCGES